MRTTFDDIVKAAIVREGGLVNDPDDRGGATNMGVTLACLRTHNIDVNQDGVIDINDIRCMDYEQAVRVYREFYWEPSRAADLPGYLRDIYFDMVINHGQANAVRILQHAASHKGLQITIDGRMGPQTMGAAPSLEIEDVVTQRLLFYTDIQLKNPSQRKFARGWYRQRCLAFVSN